MNPFIKEFIKKISVSQEDLKSSFRKLSKKTHPDLGGSEADFIELQRQYEEAREFLKQTAKEKKASAEKLSSYKAQAREALFLYLRHYKILGLPFAMLKRQDPRFEKIWTEVQFWAGWYDPYFKGLINQYHQLFSVKAEIYDRYFIIAQKHFEKAFIQFLDYQLTGIKPQIRICLSYIHDARSYLTRGKTSDYHKNLKELLLYFKETLEK